jgi:hypothetical protein
MRKGTGGILNGWKFVFMNKAYVQSTFNKAIREGIFFKIVFLDCLWFTCLCKSTLFSYLKFSVNILYLTLVRAIGSIIILSVTYNSTSTYWLFVMMSQFPSLLFFSAFSLFIYFFARIVMEEESESANMLKPFFLFFNVFTFVAFFAISIYSNKHFFHTLILIFIDSNSIFYVN